MIIGGASLPVFHLDEIRLGRCDGRGFGGRHQWLERHKFQKERPFPTEQRQNRKVDATAGSDRDCNQRKPKNEDSDVTLNLESNGEGKS